MSQIQTEETPKESLGDFLKRHRQAMGKTLDDISRVTRIQKYFLEALENNEHTVIPGRTFARGFLRAYANEIGLDSEECLMQYEEHVASIAPTQMREISRPQQSMWLGVSQQRDQALMWKWGVGFAGVFGLLLFLAGIWMASTFRSHSPPTSVAEAPKTPEEGVKANAKMDDVSPSLLMITAKKDAELSIKIDDTGLEKISLRSGDKRILNIYKEVEINSSDKAAFDFHYNGKLLEVAGSFIKLFNRNLYKKTP